MIYQNPYLLYALFAIAIPILIHLFNLRKHKVIYFSSLRFLKEIKTKNKKKSRLKNILILLCRILAITFLILAFAKPFVPAKNKSEKNDVFIYLDNSLSMDIDFGNGNLFNIAKMKAYEIIDSYPENHNFYLITNSFLSKNNFPYTKDAIKSQIDNTSSNSAIKSFKDILSRVESVSMKNHLYYISDFQKSTFLSSTINEMNVDCSVSFIIVENQDVTNISIDSVFIKEPIFDNNIEVVINVNLSNNSSQDIVDEVIFLFIDDKQKSQQLLSLLAGEKKTISFTFQTTKKRFVNGHIQTNDSPISYDNKFYFSIPTVNKINVYSINENNDNNAFLSLFKKDSTLFNYLSNNKGNINYNLIENQNLIILNEVISLSPGLLKSMKSFTKNGGSLIIVPPSNLDNINNYNLMLNALNINLISNINTNNIKINKFISDHPIYKNVFLKSNEKINYPNSTRSYSINKRNYSSQIINYANNNEFLSSFSNGSGLIYQFSSPLDKSFNNFTTHALFVPTLINIANTALQIQNIYNIINENDKVIINNEIPKNELPHIILDQIDIIPTLKINNGVLELDINNQITKNGIYSINIKDSTVNYVAYNYKNEENNTITLSINEIEEFISKNKFSNIDILLSKNKLFKSIITEKEIGKEYWKLALILSLIFFGIEIFLLKIN
ncbi:MAG: BatA domain-containing protein [Flavobacteriales bacterium]|nr:BatA domain-containing protein [Flavobacteriales bacterium]